MIVATRTNLEIMVRWRLGNANRGLKYAQTSSSHLGAENFLARARVTCQGDSVTGWVGELQER